MARQKQPAKSKVVKRRKPARNLDREARKYLERVRRVSWWPYLSIEDLRNEFEKMFGQAPAKDDPAVEKARKAVENSK